MKMQSVDSSNITRINDLIKKGFLILRACKGKNGRVFLIFVKE